MAIPGAAVRGEVVPLYLLQNQQAVHEVVSKAPDGAIFIRKTLVYLLTGTAPARGEKDSQKKAAGIAAEIFKK